MGQRDQAARWIGGARPSSGYGSEEELVGAGPQALCAVPGDLAPRLSQLRPKGVPPEAR